MKYIFADPKPYKHQVRAFKKLWRNNGGALSMPMRSGKTRVAIDFVCAKYKQLRRPLRVLVVCPYQQGSIPRVWKREIKKYATVPGYVHVGPPKDGARPRAFARGLTWYVVHFERLYEREVFQSDNNPSGRGVQMVDAAWLYTYKPDVILVDESHRIGDPSTLANKKLYKLIKALRDQGARPSVVIMTGTMMHRQVPYVFGQFKILDDSVFGTAWTAFKKQFILMGGWGDRTVLKYVNLKLLRKKIEPLTFNMAHVPPRAPQHIVVPVQLKESLSAYREMATESLVDGVVEAPLVITRIRKLAQLASGYVRDDDREIHRFGNEMARTLQEYLVQMREGGVEKVVIGCEEYPQLADVAKAAKNAGYRAIIFHGGVKHGEKRIDRFQTKKGPIAFCCIHSSAREGIDLSAAQDAIHYDLPSSLVTFDQWQARIRKFHDHRPLTYHYLIPQGTIIAAKKLALDQKMDVVDLVMKHPSILHYKGKG